MAVCPRSIRQMAESLWTGNPVSASVIFSHQSDAAGHQRLYRMAIVPGMVLVVFSGMIGLTLRKELPLKKQLPWAFLTGMALAFFWQIREDSVWILPFIAVMTVWNVGYGILVLHKN